MRNLYRHLKISVFSKRGKINLAAGKLQDPVLKRDCRRVLLDGESRKVYDRNHKLLTQIGQLRKDLDLEDTSNWGATMREEFSPKSDISFGGVSAAVLGTAGLVIGMVLFFQSEYWKFSEAESRNTTASYEAFLKDFPKGRYQKKASHGLNELRANDVWEDLTEQLSVLNFSDTQVSSKETEALFQLATFCSDYPETSAAELARDKLDAVTENFVKNVYQIPDILAFFRRFPSTDHESDLFRKLASKEMGFENRQYVPDVLDFVEHHDFQQVSFRKVAEFKVTLQRHYERILELEDAKYKDFSTVEKMNTKEAYEKFLELSPNSADAPKARRRIIDLEVDNILKGDVGELPELQPLKFSNRSRMAEVEVKNDTQYTLTVRYSGADSQKHVIPPRRTVEFSITKGKYRVTASVDAGSVRPYAGSEDITYDEYGSSFFIRTTSF